MSAVSLGSFQAAGIETEKPPSVGECVLYGVVATPLACFVAVLNPESRLPLLMLVAQERWWALAAVPASIFAVTCVTVRTADRVTAAVSNFFEQTAEAWVNGR